MLKTLITILYLIVCLALVIVVLLQESKSEGFSGTIGGLAETYWGKNKGRSLEGTLQNLTWILSAVFILMSAVLVSKIW